MRTSWLQPLALWLLSVLAAASTESADITVRRLHQISVSSRAVIHHHAQERSRYRVPAFITGKFAEHLGANIYNGMDAQILRNPNLCGLSILDRPDEPGRDCKIPQR